MLVRRTIAAADVTAFGASAQMQPPCVRGQAFDATCTAWFRVQIDSFSFTLHAFLLLCADLDFMTVPPTMDSFFLEASHQSRVLICAHLIRLRFQNQCLSYIRAGYQAFVRLSAFILGIAPSYG
jgi:hypothetical protein